MKKQTRIFSYICLAVFPIFIGCSTPKAYDNDETFKYRVSNAYPHDPEAQTEGLIYMEGFIYEGTGPCLNGPSGLRRVEIETGKVIKIHELPEPLFGEGITIYGDRIIQLTYTSKTGFVYDKQSLEPMGEFHYLTEEGWGLTHDEIHLIMSDGTATLHYLDPLSFKEVKQLHVRDNLGPVNNLNELEFIRGEIYANVFQTPLIVRISPETGRILGTIDLSILLKGRFKVPELINLANGIAYDRATGRLFITGKYWPNIFELGIILGK
jgi:glutamine cyclotransferase